MAQKTGNYLRTVKWFVSILLLAIFIVTVPRFGLAYDWEMVGIDHINDTVGASGGTTPDLAPDGSDLYVVFNETPDNIRVKKYNGTAWESIGGIVASGISPQVAAESGNVYVSYGYNENIYVKKYNNATSTWEQLGGILNVSPWKEARYSDIAIKNGELFIIWMQDGVYYGHDPSRQYGLFVKKYNTATSAWEIVGNGSITEALTPITAAFINTPNITVADDGTVFANWCGRDDPNFPFTIYIKKWNNTSWELVGELSYEHDPSIAISPDGVPYVALCRGHHNIYVMRLNGSTWEDVGQMLDIQDTANSRYPEIIFIRQTPYVTWWEYRGDYKEAYVKKWTGVDWESVGGDLNYNEANTASHSNITKVNNIPYVGFIENDNVYVKKGAWLYEEHFSADLDTAPMDWETPYQSIFVNQGDSTIKLEVPSGSWGKVESDPISCDSNYPWLHIKISSKSNEVKIVDGVRKEGNSPWSIKLRDADDGDDEVTLINQCTKSGTFEINYTNAISGKDWDSMVIELVLEDWDPEGDLAENITIDYININNIQIYENLAPSAAVMGHVMMTYLDGTGSDGSGTNKWHGWRYNYPPLTPVPPTTSGYDEGRFDGGIDSWPEHVHPDDENKRELASVYYPYYGTLDSETYNPLGDYPPEEAAPYSQKAEPGDEINPTIEKQMGWLQMLGLNGLMIDLGNYWTDYSNPIPGTNDSWCVESLREYLTELRDNNLQAILVYEDKAHWQWFTHSSRTYCVRAAKDDLTAWLELILESTYSNVPYKINGRPVIGIYSFHDTDPGTNGPSRLSADELRAWKEEWLQSHPGVNPIIITNLKKTLWPYTPDDDSDDANELETSADKYTDVVDGLFEWPEFWGTEDDQDHHTLAEEKTRWNASNVIINRELNNRRYRMVVGGAWPGFDDEAIKDWGGGKWRKIPRYDSGLDEYTLDYHLGRIGSAGQNYALKQVATFNDWAEGTNVEPAIEFRAIYAGTGVRTTNPETDALRTIRSDIGTQPENANLGLPQNIYMIRKELSDNQMAQSAADAAYANVMDGQYSTAETIIQPYVEQLQSSPPTRTPTPTATRTPTASLTPTPTVTATPDIGQTLRVYWTQPYYGNYGEQPAGWRDETNDSTMDAEIDYSHVASMASVTRTAESDWGKVQSPTLSPDVSQYPMVKVVVADVSTDASWKLLLRQGDNHWVIQDSSNQTGTFIYNYAAITGWTTGTEDFRLEVVVESEQAGEYVLVDEVTVFGDVYYTPTATPTISATATQSATYTMSPTQSVTSTPSPTTTPTATPTIPVNAYLEDFIGTAGTKVSGWTDERNDAAFNALANISQSSSIGAVKKNQDDDWGKVHSHTITCDVGIYKYVEVRVLSITAGKTWKIGIQGKEGDPWFYYDLNISTDQTGTFEYNIQDATGWTSGVHTFSVQLVVEAEDLIEAEAQIDYVRVHRGAVQGAAVTWGLDMGSLDKDGISCHTATYTPTSSPTISPTPSTTTTIQYTATLSPTITATATPTPWLTTKEVRAFPNPARGKMMFAYKVTGSVHVVLDIYKINGERVARVDEYKDGGSGQTLRTVWDAVNVSPGIYIARLKITDEAGKIVMDMKKKVALIK